MVNDESSEIEIEQAVENKKGAKFKGLLIEFKIHEEEMQQMDDKNISLEFFQLVAPLLKYRKEKTK